MDFFTKRFFLMFVLVIPLLLSGQTSDLARNFASPPKEYSLLPFWSWNGTLKSDQLKWQIDEMMDKGIYGAFMHARAGLDESETPYFSDGFWKAVDISVNYSAMKGFHAYLYDEDKWPSGSAGGRTVAANPDEFIKKALVFSKIELSGPQTIRLNLQSQPLAVFAARISSSGEYNSETQINLTGKNGQEWNVPEGRWAVISFEMAKDPEAQIDYLDSAAVAKFIEITHGEYFKRYGKYFGNTIPGIFFDEIFANFSKFGNNIFWTDDFLQKFRKLKGYDLTDRLPLILFTEQGKSEKIRYDYFDVVKTLYVNAWFKQYADWCAEHRIWATGHTAEKLLHYKREADYFTTMGQLQVPGADNEEYRYGFPRMIDWFNTRQISSIANLYDRKRVMVEAMGGGGYIIPPEEYRYGFSMLAVYGINMFIPHLFHYTMNTPQSQADWPPSWFYQNPYWKYFKPLADYASRLSYMNAQGNEVCDVAILYPLTDLWVNGYPEKIDDDFYKEVQQTLIDHQITYNIIDPESMMKATVAQGKIKVGKCNFSVLVLPAIQSVRTDVVHKIAEFVGKGGTVIALKELPQVSERGPENDEMVAAGMKELFGFAPFNLRAAEYYQWDSNQAEHYTSKTNTAGGAAFFSRFLSQLPGIINNRVTCDLLVKSSNAPFLRFLHRFSDGREIFQFVNDRNASEIYHVSLRNTGIPSVWNPETSAIQQLENYEVKDGRLELLLEFMPRQSYFVVLDPGNPDKTKKLNTGKKNFSTSLPVIAMEGDWQFQLAPHALDYKWSSVLESDTLELPVMRFKQESQVNEGMKNHWFETDYDDTSWKKVKVEDVFNKKPGVQRYLSDWDAWWISFYDYSMHIPAIEGGDRTFRKIISVESDIRDAKLAITADQSYELFINGKTAGSDNDWKSAELIDISKYLIPGENSLEVRTSNTRGLLMQGYIRLKNGKNIVVRSDETWMVSSGKSEWQPAFLFAAPPLGKWGNIANPLRKSGYPVVVWYRQLLPAGAKAIVPPEIKGAYSVYVNSTLLNLGKDRATDISELLTKEVNEISVRVTVTDSTCGLIHPVKIVCGKVTLPLISWNKLGLNWYSGRALYTKSVEISAEYLLKGIQLRLDLGQVNHFAEIWVNDKLVTYRPWPPFEADISGYLKPGTNKITIIVANLLANQATWNILDDNINSKEARWWHDGTILREKDKLVSGLLGPVRLIPF